MLTQFAVGMNTQVLASEVIIRDSYIHKKLTLERPERALCAPAKPLLSIV